MKEQQHSLMSRLGAPNPRFCSMSSMVEIEGVRATLSLVWVRCGVKVRSRKSVCALRVIPFKYCTSTILGITAFVFDYLLAFLCFYGVFVSLFGLGAKRSSNIFARMRLICQQYNLAIMAITAMIAIAAITQRSSLG